MSIFEKPIHRLTRRIEAGFHGRGPSPFFSLQTLLHVLSFAYAAVMRFRARFYETGILPTRRLPCRVISIGNICVGGTGKTPMTVMLAACLKELGYRVVVISRGYRGRLEHSGGIVSDGRSIIAGPEDAGDEPVLMARLLRGVPVLVGGDRYAVGVRAIERFQPDVIVLDDAFQHMRLKRDLNLVLLDRRSPFGNRHVLPRGPLREPLSALERAHAVVYTRCENAAGITRRDDVPRSVPQFRTRYVPVIRLIESGADSEISETGNIDFLKGKRAVAFAGLANNRQFFESLEKTGCMLEKAFSYADHRRYDPSDMEAVIAAAIQANADVLATSFKDYVKLGFVRTWPLPLVVIDATIDLGEETNCFKRFVLRSLGLPAN